MGSPALSRTRSINVGSMMRANDAMRRFKKTSKSFKLRKDKERTAPATEDMDVNWSSAFDS